MNRSKTRRRAPPVNRPHPMVRRFTDADRYSGNEPIEQRNGNKVQRVATYLVVLLLVDLGRLQRLGLPSCKAKPSRRVRTLENEKKNQPIDTKQQPDPTRSQKREERKRGDERTLPRHGRRGRIGGRGGETLGWRAPRRRVGGERRAESGARGREREETGEEASDMHGGCVRETRAASPWESFGRGNPGRAFSGMG